MIVPITAAAVIGAHIATSSNDDVLSDVDRLRNDTLMITDGYNGSGLDTAKHFVQFVNAKRKWMGHENQAEE